MKFGSNIRPHDPNTGVICLAFNNLPPRFVSIAFVIIDT